MKKVLILCTTCYQFIMAISMSMNNFKEDRVSIILTDMMNNKAEELCRKLVQENLFQDVFYIAAKDRFSFQNQSIIHKIVLLKNTIYKGGSYADIYCHEYDLFLYHHMDAFSMELFCGLQQKNMNLQCARFEEGILSYNRCENNQYEGEKLALLSCSIRKCMHKPCLGDKDITRKFYCCYPEIYTGKLQPIRVPFLTKDDEMLQLLCRLFSIDTAKLQYNEKYIMLTSIFDFEGESAIGELEIAKRISDLLANESENKLLVKTHPRDTRNVYLNAGFHVDVNSHIPWEIIQLVVDFSDKVLLTVSSGSALSTNMILENPPQTFFLYELCDWQENSMATESVEMIKRLLQEPHIKERFKHMHVVHDLEEILTYDNV